MITFRPLIVKSRPHLLPLLLLFITAAGIYGQTFDHRFLVSWDDTIYVTGNEAIRGFTPANLKTAFTTLYTGNYAPIQIVSYMLDYSLWGLRAGGFLLTNLFCHAASSFVLYLLLLRLHGRRPWALWGAFFFLVHPLQVESVAWVSQRKNVLAMFFLLMAFLLFTLYRQRESRPRLLYLLSLIIFSLALLTKAVTVFLPLALLLADRAFFRKTWRQSLTHIIPYLGLAAVVGVATVISQDPSSGGGRAEYWGGSPAATLATMLPVLVRYVGMVLWPLSLSPAYGQPYKSGIDGDVLIAALVLAACAGAVCLLYRRSPRLGFWSLFGLLALLPAAQIVPLVTLMNDRYLYFPMVGVAALFGGGATWLTDRLSGWWRRSAVAAGLCLLLALAGLARQQTTIWHDATTLWRHAAKTEPNCSLAWLGLGHAYMYDGYMSEALDALLRSYRLFPQDQDTLLNLGLIYTRGQAPLQARPYLKELLQVNPQHPAGWFKLGENYRSTGEGAAAAEAFRQGFATNPSVRGRVAELGDIYREMGKLGEAEAVYRQGVATGDEAVLCHYGLAAVAARSTQVERALAELGQALNGGFVGFYQLDHDRDFDTIRQLPAFLRLVAPFRGEVP